ncbi:hypothetical protein F4805DRAFT_475433 [Annulohypoxylon moriforme]|nr:hypothetical protein F4805DRAFT_475433 [Annulohypoxylon moriforme]
MAAKSSPSFEREFTPLLLNEPIPQVIVPTTQNITTQAPAPQRPARTPLPRRRPRPSPRRLTTRVPTLRAPTCTKCSKEFKNKLGLKQHSLEVHIGTECFWEDCGETFSNERQLNKHLWEHNVELSQGHHQAHTHQCQWDGCKCHYSMAETLARHLRKHNTMAKNAHKQ